MHNTRHRATRNKFDRAFNAAKPIEWYSRKNKYISLYLKNVVKTISRRNCFACIAYLVDSRRWRLEVANRRNGRYLTTSLTCLDRKPRLPVIQGNKRHWKKWEFYWFWVGLTYIFWLGILAKPLGDTERGSNIFLNKIKHNDLKPNRTLIKKKK